MRFYFITVVRPWRTAGAWMGNPTARRRWKRSYRSSHSVALFRSADTHTETDEWFCQFLFSTGRSTMNVVPLPGLLSTRIDPPCA